MQAGILCLIALNDIYSKLKINKNTNVMNALKRTRVIGLIDL